MPHTSRTPEIGTLHGLLAVVMTLMLAGGAAAQPAGNVAGQVVDPTGGALPGTIVELQAEGQPLRATTTDVTGRYRFDAVAPGASVVTFRLLDFSTVRREIVVAPGATLEADVVLYVSITADLTVTAQQTFRHLAELDPVPDDLTGLATAASQGVVTAQRIAARPLLRVGEVLETIPGVVITQHSGEGKANQYYLRGFNLDHGTDFATNVAGLPVNLPTHGHGHGYTDLAFLIPELVSGVQFRKGPYMAEDGDFSAAGGSDISYVSELPAPLVRLETGQDGWARLVGAASPRVGGGVLLAALELSRNDGPWVRPDDARKASAVLRFTRADAGRRLSLTAMGYAATWGATDQIPARAVASGLVSRFGGLDATLGGSSDRVAVVGEYERAGAGTVTRATGYAHRYGLDVYSNFTYFLDDPDQGDQFEQVDRRWTGGGRIVHRRLARWGGRPVEAAIGAQLRHDAIGTIGLFRTLARERLSTVRQDAVDQTSVGVHGDVEVTWMPRLRTRLGLRGDLYRFGVRAGDPRNGGTDIAGRLSPKATLTLGPWTRTELYLNGGFGFHSNDARGATITVDPVTGTPADRVTPLAGARGAEIGVRTLLGRGTQSTVALWTLDLDSELLFVGDAGTTEATRPSRRIGLEWTTSIQLGSAVALDADLAWTSARFTDDDPAGTRIPGAPGRVVALGVTVDDNRPLFGSLRLRHFGARPLVEDDGVRSRATTLVTLRLGARLATRVRIVADLFNLLDATHSDVDYFYESRLSGEPADGIADLHFHPTPPRTLRVALRLEL